MFSKKLFGLLVIVVSIEGFNKILEQNVYRFMPRVCRTDDCNTVANVILSAINRTINPCEDFYEYACGAWINSNMTLPPDKAMWSRMAMFNKKLSEKFRTLLEANSVDELSVEKAKKWYRSCMDEEALEIRGILPLTSIATAVGGWPIAMALGEWNPADYSWQEIEFYYSRITGSYALYRLVVAVNSVNASLNKISLKAPSLPLSKILQIPRKSFDLENRESYSKLIAGVARAFATAQGARVSDEKIGKEVNDMIEFEMELDKLTKNNAITTHNISLLQQLVEEQMPNTHISRINLLKLVQNLVEGIGEIEITDEETITVEVHYIIELGALLNKTSFRTIVNWIHWHYISRFLYTTNSEMRNLLLEFIKQTEGIRTALPRWEQCVNQMELKHALSYQFVLEYFTEETYNMSLEMISKIQTQLEREINGSTWLNEQAKDILRDKLSNVKAVIGFPNWYNNVTNVNHYYEELTIDNDYFNNVLNYMRFEEKKLIRTLRFMENQSEWPTNPITLNAFYMIDANSLNIPAAVFQSPLFTPTMPEKTEKTILPMSMHLKPCTLAFPSCFLEVSHNAQSFLHKEPFSWLPYKENFEHGATFPGNLAVKYGIIGSILGHELSHGFDDTGFSVDKNGELVDWPDDMASAYWQRTQCFIDQYNNLTSDNTTNRMSGYHTVGENIADTTGLQTVFGAYKSVVRENVKGDRKLPGLGDFSNEQLFLLSYATLWCQMSTPEYLRKSLLSGDRHGSPRIRTLAPLSNIEGFAKAFNCSKESPMNPEKKCNIWSGEPAASSNEW